MIGRLPSIAAYDIQLRYSETMDGHPYWADIIANFALIPQEGIVFYLRENADKVH